MPSATTPTPSAGEPTSGHAGQPRSRRATARTSGADDEPADARLRRVFFGLMRGASGVPAERAARVVLRRVADRDRRDQQQHVFPPGDRVHADQRAERQAEVDRRGTASPPATAHGAAPGRPRPTQRPAPTSSSDAAGPASSAPPARHADARRPASPRSAGPTTGTLSRRAPRRSRAYSSKRQRRDDHEPRPAAQLGGRNQTTPTTRRQQHERRYRTRVTDGCRLACSRHRRRPPAADAAVAAVALLVGERWPRAGGGARKSGHSVSVTQISA